MLIAKENIFLDKHFAHKEEIFHFLAVQAVKQGWAASQQAVEDELWRREREYSTGLEGQIAMPHAKSIHVQKAGVIFIRLTHPIDWQSLDGEPVKLIFALLVPASGAKNLHLQIINELACQIIDDDFRQRLFDVKNADELFSFMKTRIKKMEDL